MSLRGAICSGSCTFDELLANSRSCVTVCHVYRVLVGCLVGLFSYICNTITRDSYIREIIVYIELYMVISLLLVCFWLHAGMPLESSKQINGVSCCTWQALAQPCVHFLPGRFSSTPLVVVVVDRRYVYRHRRGCVAHTE